MANTVLVGLQWGDEGKGKVIDVLTRDTKFVVRFQGGNNAGHTVEVGDDKYVLHLIPSGILREETINVIGNGLVVDILELDKEIQGLLDRGIDVMSRLRLSNRSHLIFAFHRIMDGLNEVALGENMIGTTKRGIGPAYSDKVNRNAIRACDLLNPATLARRFREQATAYNKIFADNGVELVDIDAELEKVEAVAKKLRPIIADTAHMINQSIKSGENVLFEGAQGTWLDVDFGTYPFVTSSNTTAGGAAPGTGVSPRCIDHVMGIVKAYTTRVGEGPFMTELFDEDGAHLAKIGHEFGATTGRPRRCGWLDAVATRAAVEINGADMLTVTKLDVLDELPIIKICTAYKLNGEVINEMPLDLNELENVEPVYEEHPGWQTSTCEAQCIAELPENAQKYLQRMEELLNSKVRIVSVGPRRSQTFYVD